MPTPTEKPNFVEEIRKDEANKVDLDEYRFLQLDPYRGYCFMRRQKPRKAATK